MSTKVLKQVNLAICRHLLYLFNLSLRTGSFPDTWKFSFITPIFKRGTKANVANYRGIAILSAIPKLFESLVVKKLVDSVKHLINPNHHGFETGKLTVTNLVEYAQWD